MLYYIEKFEHIVVGFVIIRRHAGREPGDQTDSSRARLEKAPKRDEPDGGDQRHGADDEPHLPAIARAFLGTVGREEKPGQHADEELGDEKRQDRERHVGALLPLGGDGGRIFIESRGPQRFAEREEKDEQHDPDIKGMDRAFEAEPTVADEPPEGPSASGA